MLGSVVASSWLVGASLLGCGSGGAEREPFGGDPNASLQPAPNNFAGAGGQAPGVMGAGGAAPTPMGGAGGAAVPDPNQQPDPNFPPAGGAAGAPVDNPDPNVDPDPNTDPEPDEPMANPIGPVEVGSCTQPKEYNGNGSITYYTFDMGTEVPNCSYAPIQKNPDVVPGISTGDGRYFGAINTTDYNAAAACGACVEVSRDNGRSVVITIVDQCPVGTNPKCQAGHIDLSREAFQQVADLGEGYVGTGNGGQHGSISWRYVPCDGANDSLTYTLKEPDNEVWNQVLIGNHRYPITKVQLQVNGEWRDASRQSYNYWEPPNGDMGTAPYRIRVTDVNGTIIEDEFDHGGGTMTGGTQLPICQ